MILDFFVIQFLETTYMFLIMAFLMNRKHLIAMNMQRILVNIITIFLMAGIVFALRYIPGVPFTEYRILIVMAASIGIYMLVLQLNWLQSFVGVFLLFISVVLMDGFSVIFYKIADIPFDEQAVTVNLQTLPSLISSRLLMALLVFLIAKFKVVIKIPDSFKIEKSVYKMVVYLVLLAYIVFVSLSEVIMGSEEIRVVFIATVAIAGAILGSVIVKYTRMEAEQLKELRKTRNKIKTGEILEDIIEKKSKK